VEQVKGGKALQISAGVQYWVVVKSPAPDNWDAWNLNTTGAVGNFAQEYNGTWNAYPGSTLGAFAVYGVPIN
jgi:hypothetical protein